MTDMVCDNEDPPIEDRVEKLSDIWRRVCFLSGVWVHSCLCVTYITSSSGA